MKGGPEYNIVEKPIIDYLTGIGYNWLKPVDNVIARDGLNQVILRDTFITSIIRINNISEDDARVVYLDLLNIQDNEKWTHILRGDYSKTIQGESKKKTIHLIDFINTSNNIFTVSNQYKVEAERSRIPDIVCFINGIPIVVIEAKSPVSVKDKMGEAFEQIKQYENDIKRLFYSNAFNIITDGRDVLYGSTKSPSDFWGEWKDPWGIDVDFKSKFEQGLHCLLEPSRLLDLLAHFIVFEHEENKVIKKICRYQQYRAVNKIVNRVLEDRKPDDRRGLIWHTQGSGKSLTMAFTALKLKSHLNIKADILSSPNILILTDRVDLDDQISKTFKACNLPNPLQIESIPDLYKKIHANTQGLTVLSTIFKFSGHNKPVSNSKDWIILQDESHRTAEKDLGAYVRATFPEAYFFGFTGTPIQNNLHDTYRNFSPKGELYLDKYSIDDAVADGATVPIHYTSRKTEWQLEGAEVDILFDQWFANEPEDVREDIKKRGLTRATLAKHHRRVELIAYDLWNHYKTSAMIDGYKAQIVCVDREAIILYKRALDKIIAKDLEKEGLTLEDIKDYAIPIYSPDQSDAKPSEDSYIQGIRDDIVKYQVNDDKSGKWSAVKRGTFNKTEKEVKSAFKIKGKPPYFLIVCSKLLTGFDAPVESVMYLDSPLKEHSLLQAIARTNRVEGSSKRNGLIVDYIGVTRNLYQALSSYRKEDVSNAMHDLDELRSELRSKHSEIMQTIKGIDRNSGNLQDQYQELIQALGSEDVWLLFKQKAQGFIKAYETLSPDPVVLKYQNDLKWIVGFLAVATSNFEKKDGLPSLKSYSGKIREMLNEHLDVTGLTTLIQLRQLTDPDFNKDFQTEGKDDVDLKVSAIRKATELKKIIKEKILENEYQFQSFAERILELIKKFDEGLLTAKEMLEEEEKVTDDLNDEINSFKKSGLNKKAHGIYKILDAFKERNTEEDPKGESAAEKPTEYKAPLSKYQLIAIDIDELYSSAETAPAGWHLKEQLKKELRRAVRRIILPAGFTDWKQIPVEVETYALKYYVKIV
ncbi:MAG: type I restriction endonuclease subunit R [Spirochaetaceae bacterium]|nr:type I restriction endonuclease subunit R [Spirochaetaceae bacterium]